MSAPVSSLRAGVIGTGFIGPVHIENLKRLGVRVTAVCGSTASARACADQWGIPEVYGDYDYEALCRSSNVDVVHIASPNKFHVGQALAALAAGKHVVCEKPLGLSTRETRKALAAASRKDAPVLAVNYMCRFFPAVLQMRAMVRRGDLGRVIHVEGRFFQDWLLHAADYNWRLLASDGGKLRAVGDIGTHWIDTAAFILGAPVKAVFAHLETFHQTRYRPRGEVRTFAAAKGAEMIPYRCETEDFGSLLLRFGRADHPYVDGAHASASISQVAAGWKCGLSIGVYGEKAGVRWNLEEPNEIIVGRRDQPSQILQRGCPGFSEDIAGFTDYPGGHPEGFPDSHKMQYRAVYQHIVGGRSAPALFATATDGHEEVRLCEAILKSSNARRWITL